MKTDLIKILNLTVFPLLKILGFFPYSVTKTELVYNRSKNILSMCILLALLATMFLSFVTAKNDKPLDMNIFIFSFVVYLTSLTTVALVTIASNKFHTIDFLHLWNKIIGLNDDLLKRNMKVDYAQMYCKGVVPSSIEILLTVLYSVLLSQTNFLFLEMTPWNRTMSVFGSVFFNVINVATSNIYFCVLVVLTDMLEVMNSRLKFLHYNDMRCFIKELSTLRDEVNDISRLLNTVLALPLLFLIGLYFILFTVNTFLVVLSLSEGNFDWYVGSSAIYIVFCVVKVSNFAKVASDFKIMGNHINRTVHEQVVLIKNKGFRKEANVFSMSMLHGNVTINAAGFFVIDYQLLFSIGGSVATYIIILIQFNKNN